jgi:hypothetical protein
MLDRITDRSAVSERTIEPDRERARRIVADRTVHSHDAVDLGAQRLGLYRAVTSIEHNDARPAGGNVDDHGQDSRRNWLWLALLVLEHQASATASVAAEVDHGGIQLRQVTHEFVDADGPARLKTEVVSVRRHLELTLDLRALLPELEQTAPEGVRREEEDHVLLHAAG